MDNTIFNRFKKPYILLILLLIILGSGFLIEAKKQAKEEKHFLGQVRGYNPKIKELEKLFKEQGYDPGEIDGVMNKQTRKCIKDFQKANKLEVSGFIDAQTHARLEILKSESIRIGGSSKDKRRIQQIKQAQQMLKRLGFDPGNTKGIITAKTKKAIKAFQRSMGLVADGLLGPKTLTALMKCSQKTIGGAK